MSSRNDNKDYYTILGVTKNATSSEIKKAFMKRALIWHPNKVKTNGKNEKEIEQLKELHTKKYTLLQKAYQCLTNPKKRQQYNQAMQTTQMSLTDREKRNVEYKKTDKFTKIDDDGKRVFDNNQFDQSFNQARNRQDAVAMKKLQQQYDRKERVTKSTIEQLETQREEELDNIKSNDMNKVLQGKWDPNAFNRMFDHMKKNHPEGQGLQEYNSEPMGLFSGGGGLVEQSNLSGISLTQGTDFKGTGMNSMVYGESTNPTANMDISQFKVAQDKQGTGYVAGSGLNTGDERYNQVGSIGRKTIKQLIAERTSDTERLQNLGEQGYDGFINNPSEVEQQFSELFEPVAVDQLESGKRSNKSKSKSKSTTKVT